ncbi:ABC transporter ATP-binding protein [Streptomyces sp. NPDC044989]|uniref:ABC transporter ATP-binding protein n=1 Tax=Streptomyces sp. NPDC044989 TaxID=3154336 RepID=UPI0033D36AB0
MVALYMATALVGGSLPVLVAWLTKELLDELIAGTSIEQAVVLGTALGLTGMGMGLLPHASTFLRSCLDRRVGLVAQTQLFGALGNIIGLAPFESPAFLDRLRMAKSSGARSSVQLVDALLSVTRSLITLSGFLGTLLVIAPTLTAILALFGIPVLFAELSLARSRTTLMWKVTGIERREFLYDQLLSGVDAAKEIRVFGIGSFLRDRLLADRREINSLEASLDRRTLSVQLALGAIAALVAGIGMIWCAVAAHDGRISVGDITVLVAAITAVQSTFAQCAAQIASMHEVSILFENYDEIINAPPDLPVAEKPIPISPLRDCIELRNVWFRYDDSQDWILRGVNLKITAGQSSALVGLNGAGKSTIVKLLCRFYDPTQGSIHWDGIDFRDLDVDELRARISTVFQDYMHYEMTARENISMGDLAALRDPLRIQDAAARAGIDAKLRALPQGYETLLSRMFSPESFEQSDVTGVSLSGGQWQRVALARSFIRQGTDFLILDEPSAGLDPAAEHDIHTSLMEFSKGTTSLLISHRLGAVRDADRIMVLTDGEISEEGTHSSLLKNPGKYASLFRTQAAGYAEHESVGK